MDAKRSKRLDRRHLDHLAKIVRDVIGERSQGEFAREIGVSQSHVSQMARGGRSDRGVGLPVLIAMREYLRKIGRPQTLDQLLGLDPIPTPAAIVVVEPVEADELRRLREAVEQINARLGHPESSREHVRLPPARRRREKSEV